MKFCCETFHNHVNEGFLQENRYFISGLEGAPSEKREFFAEVSFPNKIESQATRIPLNYCPFCGEKL